MEIITNGFRDARLRDFLEGVADAPIQFRAAVAFLSSAEMINRIAADPKNKVHVVVALAPPTNYYALQEISRRNNVQVDFIRDGFHSKIYLISNDAQAIGSIGSSNLTGGGLADNIETNVILTDDEVQEYSLADHFQHIVKCAEALTPEVLEAYKAIYDAYVASKPSCPSKKPGPPPRLRSLAARSFIRFWTAIDHARDIVKDLAKQHFPTVPAYIAIDHFWHYVVSIVRETRTHELVTKHGSKAAVELLFKEYAAWSTGENDWRAEQLLRIKLIQTALSPNAIGHLSKEDAVQLYACLHANTMPIQRFSRDKDFVKRNSMTKIIRTLRALLHDEAGLAYRIDKALKENKLDHFGDSNVQELNGWYAPDKYPIRNGKANDALRWLGLLA